MEYKGVDFGECDSLGRYSLTNIFRNSKNWATTTTKLYNFMRSPSLVDFLLECYQEEKGCTFSGKLVQSLSGLRFTDKHLMNSIISRKRGKYGGTWANEKICKIAVDTLLKHENKKVNAIICQEGCLKTIEQLLGVTLIREFSCPPYRIDGYDQINNIAYEIDEAQHSKTRKSQEDKIRQEYISAILGCTFKRIKL